jgi:uncharacterized membrane protein (UPF0182 family)
VPSDPTSSATSANQPPYYVLATPPGSSADNAQFQLTSPMNVNNSTYLAADVSVDSDPGPNYGKITVLQLPRGSSAVQGPEQIFNVLNSNATITKDLSLFNTSGGGSTVIHGNLLTLPIGNSFLYVEPLYTQGTGGSGNYPVLQRVIVVYGDIIGYGATLADALSNLSHPPVGISLNIGSTSTPSGSATPTPSATPSTSSSPAPSQSSVPSNVDVVLSQLDAAITKLQQDYKSGNLATIGADQQAIANLLQQYSSLRASPSAAPSSTPKPSPTATKTS